MGPQLTHPARRTYSCPACPRSDWAIGTGKTPQKQRGPSCPTSPAPKNPSIEPGAKDEHGSSLDDRDTFGSPDVQPIESFGKSLSPKVLTCWVGEKRLKSADFRTQGIA